MNQTSDLSSHRCKWLAAFDFVGGAVGFSEFVPGAGEMFHHSFSYSCVSFPIFYTNFPI